MDKPSTSSFALSQIERDHIAKLWSDLVGRIDHDFTTPLVTMNMIFNSLLKNLPHLMEAYKLATDNGLMENVLGERQLAQIQDVPETAIELVKKLFDLLHWLRPIYKEILVDSSKAKNSSAKDFIDSFINQSCFSESQRNSIAVINQSNFNFKLSEFFLQHLLLCLSEITLGCWVSGDAKAEISPSIEDNYNVIRLKIYFADGCGKSLPNGRFHSLFFKSPEEEKIQIPFCKMALIQVGSDIDYEFVAEEHLTFLIKFSKDF